jgi:hypothetical protein
MYDREYELYDVFGKNPLIQPSMRRTSKLAYGKSQLSFFDVQCQQSISKREIANFIQNHDDNDIAIFETYSADTAYEEYDALVAYVGGWWDYTVKKGVKRGYGDENVTAFFATLWIRNDSKYDQLVESLSEQSMYGSFTKSGAIFTGPFTTYEILSERHTCVNLNKNYPKIQTLKEFDQVIDRYSHFSQALFLNAYLVASATVMGIENSGLQGYGLDVDVTDRGDEEEANIYYNNELAIYAEETNSERVNLIQKIRNKIINLK